MGNENTLTFRRPATRWTDALPTGNGHIGAMLYGSICDDFVLLNHEAAFRPQKKSAVPDVSDALPELRRLLAQGNYTAASSFYPNLISEGGKISYKASYHPVCDIHIQSETSGPFTRYRRGIDLNTGLVWSRWAVGGIEYSRELFVSRADGIVVLRLTTDRPRCVTARLSLIPPPTEPETESRPVEGSREAEYTIRVDEGESSCIGRFSDYSDEYSSFGAKARIVAIGNGSSSRTDRNERCVEVADADEILVLVTVEAGIDADRRVAAADLDTAGHDFDDFFENHRAIHEEIYSRTVVKIGNLANERADRSTDTPAEDLLSAAFEGEVSTGLILSMYRFGRYLAICSNGSGGWPANLQGIWNGAYHPPWQSDYHNDENIQMNYWAVLPSMMPEMMKPLFDYYMRYIDDYRDNARKLYDCRGIFLPIAQTTTGSLYPSIWSYWTAGAGWLAQHFYDYYLFTKDEGFLESTAIPWLLETAEFYEDFLTEDETGELVFSPSLSPENRPAVEGGELVSINATMDVAICREVLSNLIEACNTTGDYVDRLPTWKMMLEKLPPYEVNEDGALREWLHPGLTDNYHHRHQSHIYPLFPGFSVTEEDTPELFEACRIAIEKRLVIGLSSQTGWSFAHMANVWARLGEGDKALEVLGLLTRSCTGTNLFTYHNDSRAMGLTLGRMRSNPLFQIDANFGISAAVLEMLVFSRPGLVKLLPALPSTWRAGRAGKILCRGGIEIEMEWNLDRRSVFAELTSRADQRVELKLPGLPATVSVKRKHDGESAPIQKSNFGERYIGLSLVTGEPIVVEATLATPI